MNRQTMEISGHTKLFAVLGHPITHSLSPAMHNASLSSLGMDAAYLAFDVHPSRLMNVLSAMADMGFGGVNLTVPLKEKAYAELTDVAESARRLGAVNTIQFLPGGMRGHNTDGEGFLSALRDAFGMSPAGLSVFILGTGGAGRAIAITCAAAGAARIVMADEIEERPKKVALEIAALAPFVKVMALSGDHAAWGEESRCADLVVQATPVGMSPQDSSTLTSDCFRKDAAVFDLVYMFPESAFMREAREGGAKAANGLGMLLHQGAASFSIWTGNQPDVPAMRAALEQRVYGHTNKSQGE